MIAPVWLWIGLGRGVRRSAYATSLVWSVLFMIDNTGVQVTSAAVFLQCVVVGLIWPFLIFRAVRGLESDYD